MPARCSGGAKVICRRFHLSAAPRIARAHPPTLVEIIDDVSEIDKPFRRLAWNSISKGFFKIGGELQSTESAERYAVGEPA